MVPQFLNEDKPGQNLHPYIKDQNSRRSKSFLSKQAPEGQTTCARTGKEEIIDITDNAEIIAQNNKKSRTSGKVRKDLLF